MDQHEKNNIIETLQSSLDSVFQEKLQSESVRSKLEDVHAKVNVAVISNDKQDPERAHVSIIIENGTITVQNGKLPDAHLELAASFETFFTIATGALNSTKALLVGKLKVKGGFKHLKKLLLLQKLLVLDR